MASNQDQDVSFQKLLGRIKNNETRFLVSRFLQNLVQRMSMKRRLIENMVLASDEITDSHVIELMLDIFETNGDEDEEGNNDQQQRPTIPIRPEPTPGPSHGRPPVRFNPRPTRFTDSEDDDELPETRPVGVANNNAAASAKSKELKSKESRESRRDSRFSSKKWTPETRSPPSHTENRKGKKTRRMSSSSSSSSDTRVLRGFTKHSTSPSSFHPSPFYVSQDSSSSSSPERGRRSPNSEPNDTEVHAPGRKRIVSQQVRRMEKIGAPTITYGVSEEAKRRQKRIAAKTFQCIFIGCLSQFASKGALNRHVEDYHFTSPSIWKCGFCGAKFNLRRNLLHHMARHENELTSKKTKYHREDANHRRDKDGEKKGSSSRK